MAFTPIVETFTIVSDNTFPANLSFTPLDNDDALLFLNGIAASTLGGSPAFSIAGVVPTYTPANNNGFDMTSDTNVKIMYFADV